jgi:hypothetical protein
MLGYSDTSNVTMCVTKNFLRLINFVLFEQKSTRSSDVRKQTLDYGYLHSPNTTLLEKLVSIQ